MTKIKKIVFILLLELFLTSQVQAEWLDITPRLETTQTLQALDRVKRVLFSYVTVKNISTNSFTDPIRVNIINPSIQVLNAQVNTEDGVSYILIPNGLAAGETAKVRVDFKLERASLSFGVQLMQQLPVDPQLLSHQFIELRGREGHQGFFPLFSSPTAGDAKLQLVTNKDVKSLTVVTMTDFGNSEFVATLNETSVKEENQWNVSVVLPSTPFKLRFDMVSEYGDTVSMESNTIDPRTFSVVLSLQEGHSFSPGENNAVLSITNHSNINDNYDIIINGSEDYLNSPIVSKTIEINSFSTANVTIPILVPKDIFTHTLTVTTKVKESAAIEFEEATLEILVMDEPLVLSGVDSEIVVDPSSCEPLDRLRETVNIVIPGTGHLDVENIDLNSIKIIGDNIQPINTELNDISSTADTPCENQQADGKIDLVLTFDLQAILATNNNALPGHIYLSIKYYTKSGMRYTHEGQLLFQ